MKKAFRKGLSIFLAITIIFSSAYIGLGEIDFSGINFNGLLAIKAKAARSGTYDGGTWSLDDYGTLTISGITIIDCYYDSKPWYSLRNSVTEIVLGNGVQKVEYLAFSGFDNVVSITLSSTVSVFDPMGNVTPCLYSINVDENNINYFSYDGVLYRRNLPYDTYTLVFYPSPKTDSEYEILENTTCIGFAAFWGCTNLTSLTIPETVNDIRSENFYDCLNLENIYITNLASWCNINFECSPLAYAKNLYLNDVLVTDLVIPDGITYIKDGAFEGYKKLASVTIPDSVTSIGYNAFYGCTSLASITIPDGVTNIGEFAFYNTAYYNNTANWDNGVLYIDNHLIEAETTLSGSYEIKAATKTIALNAFAGCTGLSSITIPNSVTSISYSAFAGCTGLTSITIPDSVTSIDYYAFSGCSGLTSITIPESVTSIGSSAFRNCTGLQKLYWNAVNIPDFTAYSTIFYNAGTSGSGIDVVFGDGVEHIPGYLFYTDSSSYKLYIKTVTISDTVKSIGSNAFYCWKNLKDVYYVGTEADWKNISIGSNNGYLTSASIHYIDQILTFTLNSDGESYSITDCDEDFSGELVIPSTYNGKPVTRIGAEAFYNCTKLTSISIPTGVTSIGKEAFCVCTNLTSIIIPNSVKSIGAEAFYDCPRLTSVTIPDSVKSIGKYTFYGCTSLTSITIPNSVTTVDEGAFSNCSSLASITIPESVTTIGVFAFWGCTSLTDVYYGGTEADWKNISIGSNNGYLTSATIHYHVHTYDSEWVIDASPSCTEAGSKHNTCSICNKLVTEEIPATGHIDTEWITEKNPNCTESGYKDEWCLDCFELINTEEIPATGHLNTEWITEKNPNCTESGYKDEWCLDCFEIINTEEILALGHSYGDWVVEVEPTCNEGGLRYHSCSVCGDVETEKVSANGHSYSEEWTIDVAPTCTEEGVKSHYCLACGDKADVTVVEPLGHTYSTEWTIDVKPTCTEDGSKSHHCIGCDKEIVDVTVVEPLGHDFESLSVADEHPHINTFKCSRCPETKQEESYSEKCGICNFTYTDNDNGTCKITGYIGSSASMFIPASVDGKTVVNTNTGAFKSNTSLTSVIIEDGVQGIGSLAFLGCSSLSKAVIPASVTSIGTKAFYTCASDFTIYCYRDSYAMQYAIDNSLNYVIMDIAGTDDCTIDYTNKLIFATKTGVEDIEELLSIPATSTTSVTASLVVGDEEYLGTGSIVAVTDGDVTTEYTLIVNGDTNGDSACDVLDCFDVERASNGNGDLTGAYAMAADSNSDEVVDVTDYQNVVNKALAS